MNKKEFTQAELKEQARLLKNRYQREWKKNNPEKVKGYMENYWLKVAETELRKDKEIQSVGIGEEKPMS